MRIAVYGAGAIGGHVAARLANAGHQVAIVARGEHLAAIRDQGLLLRAGDAEWRSTPAASEDPSTLGPQDVVMLTLKAHALSDAAARIEPLLHPDTIVVFAQNGIPWWYSDRVRLAETPLPNLSLLDPSGAIRRTVGVDRTIGCVVYSAAEIAAPGVVVNGSPGRNSILVGEIDDAATSRIAALRALLTDGGFDSPIVTDIRHEIWTKLCSTLRRVLLGFLTERTSRAVWDHPDLRPIVDLLAGEVAAIAAAYRIDCAQDMIGPMAGHKSSMLQDYERGRPIEFDALLSAPLAFAVAAGVPVPALRTVAALIRVKSEGSNPPLPTAARAFAARMGSR